jgi:transcription termination factor Rho
VNRRAAHPRASTVFRPHDGAHGRQILFRTAISFMAEDTLRPAESDESTARAGKAASTAEANGTETPKRTRRTKAQIEADKAAAAAAEPDEKPKRTRRTKAQIEADKAAAAAAEPDEKPKRTRRTKAQIEADSAPAPSAQPESGSAEGASEARPPRPPRRSRAPRSENPESAGEAPAPETSAPEAAGPESSDGAPRRRRTRRAAEAEPVASSDNLPPEVAEPAPEAPQHGQGGQRQQRQEPQRQQEQQGRREAPRYDEEGGGRRRNKRKRNKGGNPNQGGQQQGGSGQNGGYDGQQGGQQQGGGQQQQRGGYGGQQGGQQRGGYEGQNQGGGQQRGSDNQNQGGGPTQSGHPGEPFDGLLELIGDKKFGFIRSFTTSLNKGDNDPFMPPPLIQKYNLRDGVRLTGIVKPGRKGAWQVTEVHEVMGMAPEAWAEVEDFEAGMVIYPEEKLRLVADKDDLSMRVIDLVAPLGRGQRALIVAPPRAGKTVILKGMAAGITKNHPDVTLVALLIDERPEEVTDFRRNTDAVVFASSNDFGEDNHVRVATLAFEYSRRLVEQGKDVVILLDSLTRLGRTFNLWGGNSGRTMSGGLDARALLVPRKIFGAARNIENGGSLTIVATALIETGSRMDDVIFEEFKGTGNAEIVLDRELSEQRIYPAINIRKSGTRNEDRLVAPEHLRQRHMLLRALNSRHPVEAMQALAKQIQLSESNEELLGMLVPE